MQTVREEPPCRDSSPEAALCRDRSAGSPALRRTPVQVPSLQPMQRKVQQHGLGRRWASPGLDVRSWDGACLLLLVGKSRPCEVFTDSLCVSTEPPCELPDPHICPCTQRGRVPSGRNPVPAAGAGVGRTGGRGRPARRCHAFENLLGARLR